MKPPTPAAHHTPAVVEPTVEPVNPHEWGRIDDDGLVFVRTAVGERQVGSWQAGDAEAGLHSSNFNLAENIEATDSRAGLDENAKRDVYVIMKRRGVTFDEARRIYVEGVFGREGIGADGRPLDRKAVMFS